MRKRHQRYAVAKLRAWRAVIGQSASAFLDHPASHVVALLRSALSTRVVRICSFADRFTLVGL